MKPTASIVGALIAACATMVACARRPTLEHAGRFDHDGARSEAARSFDLGVAAYERGEATHAMTYFIRAYDIAPTAVVLFNLARVQDSLGSGASAARFYVAFLHAAGTAPLALTSEATRALQRLAPDVAWILVTVGPPDRVQLDGEVVPPTPSGYPFAVLSGLHTLSVSGGSDLVLRVRPSEVLEASMATQPPRVVIGSGSMQRLREAFVPTTH